MSAYDELFTSNVRSARASFKRKRQSVALRSLLHDAPVPHEDDAAAGSDTKDSEGQCLENDLKDILAQRQGDTFIGCCRLRCLRTLLSIIDNRGFERSQHQLQFHAAFERSCSRVLYREEFPLHKTAIMKINQWDMAPGEVMISTPRRFGKTFSVAQFCACIAISSKQDIVIFSPGRRASRSILVRVHEFIRVLKLQHLVNEYNQEQLKLRSIGGEESTIRSFPSNVKVRISMY